jgi:tRNA (guanine37-N1)-methyltransferase
MLFDIITIFPNFFNNFKEEGIIGSACKNSLIQIATHNLRNFTSDKHQIVDDRPFGGGAGMVMKPEPIYNACKYLQSLSPKVDKCILLSPRGILFNQKIACKLSEYNRIVFICGRYEGIDERVSVLCSDMELSIGDYILNGGEVAAMVVIEAITRLIPGVLGCDISAITDSFSTKILEYPQYTRPRNFMGMEVPETLLSGNHLEIEKWRNEQSINITKSRRPDLLSNMDS